MTKEELIEKMKGIYFKCDNDKEYLECVKVCEDHGLLFYDYTSMKPWSINSFSLCEEENKFQQGGLAGRKESTGKEFLSWFEEKPKKKRGPKPKPCKREKIEANLKQIREDADNAETRAFKCEFDGRVTGEYVDGEYSTCLAFSPEEAIVFAKWILDLEGGK